MSRRRALTLVEVIIVSILGAFLLLISSRLLSNWMQSSVRGAAHLTHIQAASFLLSQLEQDLQRAAEVTIDQGGLQVKVLEDVGVQGWQYSLAAYQATPNQMGFHRKVARGGTTEVDRIILPQVKISPWGSRPVFRLVRFPEGRQAVQIALQVTSEKDSEPFQIERLIFFANAPGNQPLPGWIRGECAIVAPAAHFPPPAGRLR